MNEPSRCLKNNGSPLDPAINSIWSWLELQKLINYLKKKTFYFSLFKVRLPFNDAYVVFFG